MLWVGNVIDYRPVTYWPMQSSWSIVCFLVLMRARARGRPDWSIAAESLLMRLLMRLYRIEWLPVNHHQWSWLVSAIVPLSVYLIYYQISAPDIGAGVLSKQHIITARGCQWISGSVLVRLIPLSMDLLSHIHLAKSIIVFFPSLFLPPEWDSCD